MVMAAEMAAYIRLLAVSFLKQCSGMDASTCTGRSGRYAWLLASVELQGRCASGDQRPHPREHLCRIRRVFADVSQGGSQEMGLRPGRGGLTQKLPAADMEACLGLGWVLCDARHAERLSL